MASGDTILESMHPTPPDANAASPVIDPGGSTPGEQVLAYAFDAATIEYMDFMIRLLPNASLSGGITLSGPWSADAANTGNVRWGAAVRRIQNDLEDIDSAHTYDYNEVTDAAPSAIGEKVDFVITWTDGVDFDSLAAGETGILRIRREANDATNDTMSGDALLWASLIGLRET